MSVNCKRILLKVSGEVLMGNKNFGHDIKSLQAVTDDIKEVINLGVQVCLVVGGGNICRGADTTLLGIKRTTADSMGMLATIINALALKDTMEKNSIETRVQSAIPVVTICEPFIRDKAIRHMEKGKVVIFAAGLGNPFFTTDSAAVLRAIEMNCDFLFKGTNVDGIYDCDPKKNMYSKRFQEISYIEAIKRNLRVMDMSSITIARENNLPIKVFSLKEHGNFKRVLQNEGKFTIIKGK